MFGVDEALQFKSLHGFGYPNKHGIFSSSKKQLANLPHNRFLIGGPKCLIMQGDSHPT